MKKLSFILLVIASIQSAIAQNTLDKLGLSNTEQATVAYSLRLLSSNYTGPLARININGSFYDVYPDDVNAQFALTSKISASYSTYNAVATGATSNALSSVSLSNNATVAIWYDQSGNAKNLTQATTLCQPRIINAGVIDLENNTPFIRFFGLVSGNRNALDLPAPISTNGQVFIINKFAGTDGFLLGSYGEYPWHSNAGTSKLFDGTHASSSIKNSTIYQNGNLVTSASAIWNTKLAINIVAPQDPSTGTSWNNIGSDRTTLHNTTSGGGYSELIVFNTALSNSERLAVQNSQSNYYGICLLATEPSSTNQSVSLNATATTLNVSSVDPNATYQWYSNTVNSNAGGTILDGETGTTYTPNTSVEGTLYYYVIITTANQTCTSSVSGYVRTGIEITAQPSTTIQTLAQNSIATALSVTVTGSDLTYQWYKNSSNSNIGGTLIEGATASTYTPATSELGKNYYYAVITGKNTILTSNVSGSIEVLASLPTIWNGPSITFTKTAGADYTLAANQDSITNNVTITRGNSSSDGLINIVKEVLYNISNSPEDTEWALVGSNNLTVSQVNALNFTTFRSATRLPGSRFTPNQYFLVHLITDDIYLYIKILSWNTSGGFSYERSTKPNLPQAVVVTKSGESTSPKATSVDKNGALNTTKGVTKNGEIKVTK